MSITHGRAIVQTAGTAQPLNRVIVSKLVITALITNTERVAIGNDRVSAAYGYEQGAMLYPGEKLILVGSEASELYIDVVTDDEGVTWWGEE